VVGPVVESTEDFFLRCQLFTGLHGNLPHVLYLPLQRPPVSKVGSVDINDFPILHHIDEIVKITHINRLGLLPAIVEGCLDETRILENSATNVHQGKGLPLGNLPPFLQKYRDDFPPLAEHVVFHNQDIGLERLERVLNNFLSQITDCFDRAILEIPWTEKIGVVIDMEFDRWKFDDFYPVFQEKLWNACPRNDQEIYIWTMLPHGCDHRQSPEGVTHANGIVRIIHNPFEINHVTPRRFSILRRDRRFLAYHSTPSFRVNNIRQLSAISR